MIAEECGLPRADFGAAWEAIKIHPTTRTRLMAQALLCLELRQRFPFEAMPIHGLIVLSGPPGTGKTTLARGLANQVATALTPQKIQFVQVDPHALASASLGGSQKGVTKLFQQVIPERAAHGPCIVLLDEVEALAADRQRMSLEANPIDVHRATDAALAGIDLLCRTSRNTLIIATTNFPEAVDRALMSRADWIEDVGLPIAEARKEIILDVIDRLATQWPRVADLKGHVAAFVRASEGMDGRALRKALVAAAASSVDTARDLNNLRAEHVLDTLKIAAKSSQREAA